ncbi:hypothetical protein L2E82_50725 [Cichorium intybus]|nr:hypothetical protein L2E82_50725 [Cichorium intybus]
MEEAIKVSSTSQPSSSMSSSHQAFFLLNEVTDASSSIAHLIAEEIDKFVSEGNFLSLEHLVARSPNLKALKLNRVVPLDKLSTLLH